LVPKGASAVGGRKSIGKKTRVQKKRDLERIGLYY